VSPEYARPSAAASEDLLAQINRLRDENDELRSRSVTPFDGVEELADPAAPFLIHYRYKQWSQPRQVWQDLQDTVAVDWKTLLVLLAPQFATPAATSSRLCLAERL
jgi:hypothetical protein